MCFFCVCVCVCVPYVVSGACGDKKKVLDLLKQVIVCYMIGC